VTRAKISQYSATANDNTDVNGINIAENCPPSSMNNMGREIMAALKRFQVGSDGDGVTVGGALVVSGATTLTTVSATVVQSDTVSEKTSAAGVTIDGVLLKDNGVVTGAGTVSAPVYSTTGDLNTGIFFPAADTIAFAEGGAEAMRIDSSGNVGIGATSPAKRLTVASSSFGGQDVRLLRSTVINGNLDLGAVEGAGYTTGTTESVGAKLFFQTGTAWSSTSSPAEIVFSTTPSGSLTLAERMRITNSGDLLVGTTVLTDISSSGTGNEGAYIKADGQIGLAISNDTVGIFNRKTSDGTIFDFRQDGSSEGSISVSGNTVSYNAFCGGHWTQLQEGRGYNPAIPRGTVMSSIGEMAVWKSVEWTETVEHPAVEAVEAVEAVLDEDGNVIEPSVEAVEGKEAWTESIPHRESYLGSLDIGETFEEDGFTKTVVDDGNERLPKVKISDVVGDKAVYGVFQTWDEVEDMLVSSLGAFVVRIASGVTVEVGDLLESNGDGCAKVQDDDIIRSKTIGKVTSTVATETYDDGSYTVPCVLYCG
jgi:hypothetical protein